jgi:hypothetical protein
MSRIVDEGRGSNRRRPVISVSVLRSHIIVVPDPLSRHRPFQMARDERSCGASHRGVVVRHESPEEGAQHILVASSSRLLRYQAGHGIEAYGRVGALERHSGGQEQTRNGGGG